MSRILFLVCLLFAGLAHGDEQRTDRVLENPVQDGNMIFRVNDGGIKTDAITIDGANSRISTPKGPNFGEVSNIWTTGGVYYSEGIGQLYSHGSFGLTLVGNGYRNNSGTWTTYNAAGQLGATIIDMRPNGSILFGTDAAKNNGDPNAVTTRMSLDSTGKLDLAGQADIGDTLTLSKTGGPHLYLVSNAANNTNKGSYIDFAQYASGANPTGYIGLYGFADSTTNRVYYGGGTSVGNSATEHRFFTAANATTSGASATERMLIRSDGVVDISGSLILDTPLAIAEGGTGGTTATVALANLGVEAATVSVTVSGCSSCVAGNACTGTASAKLVYQVIDTTVCLSFPYFECNSNAANFTFSLPGSITPTASGYGFFVRGLYGKSNSATITAGRCQLGTGVDSTVDCRQSDGGGLFDATGTKALGTWTACYNL